MGLFSKKKEEPTQEDIFKKLEEVAGKKITDRYRLLQKSTENMDISKIRDSYKKLVELAKEAIDHETEKQIIEHHCGNLCAMLFTVEEKKKKSIFWFRVMEIMGIKEE